MLVCMLVVSVSISVIGSLVSSSSSSAYGENSVMKRTDNKLNQLQINIT